MTTRLASVLEHLQRFNAEEQSLRHYDWLYVLLVPPVATMVALVFGLQSGKYWPALIGCVVTGATWIWSVGIASLDGPPERPHTPWSEDSPEWNEVPQARWGSAHGSSSLVVASDHIQVVRGADRAEQIPTANMTRMRIALPQRRLGSCGIGEVFAKIRNDDSTHPIQVGITIEGIERVFVLANDRVYDARLQALVDDVARVLGPSAFSCVGLLNSLLSEYRGLAWYQRPFSGWRPPEHNFARGSTRLWEILEQYGYHEPAQIDE